VKVAQKGYLLAPGTFGVGRNPKNGRWAPMKLTKKHLCPIGALLLTAQPDGSDSPLVAAAGALEIHLWEAAAIQVGFDGAPCADAWPEQVYVALGAQLREEFAAR